MANYLWELDIESLPFGSKNTYEKALSECPTGINIEITSVYGEKISCYINPVMFHDKIISKFNEYKCKALILTRNRSTLEVKDFIDSIIECDVALYSLIFEWVFEFDDFLAPENRNPFVYFSNKEYLNYAFYNNDTMFCTFFKELGYPDLRLIHL